MRNRNYLLPKIHCCY